MIDPRAGGAVGQGGVAGAVVFAYESTTEDLRETVRVLSRKQRGAAGVLLKPVTWIVLGILGAALLVMAALTGSFASALLGAVLLVEALVLPWVPTLSARRQARAVGDQLVACRVTVDETGIHSVTATLDAHMAWGAFGDYVETDRLFVLRGPRRAGIRGGWIAKRGAPDQASLDHLRALLDRHLSRA
ncbi:hypothetical protein ABT026_14185 [Streptomyces sp. NPDC002734]|uniref:hypothetical protein n=1 Tax=Streptomyces sp. NPDC002734 TaxID=3154426 RepID=UPI0033238DB0